MGTINSDDLNDLSNPLKIERVYNALMLSGIKAIPENGDPRDSIFSKVCHDLIRQYLIWNDYIHSNNLMQLAKDVLFENYNPYPKTAWFVRYEVVIYGRRTPLYFIDKPTKLFEKANYVYKAGKADQSEKMTAAIFSLFDYYKANFLSMDAPNEDRELFIKHFNDHFVKSYESADKSLFPKEIVSLFEDYIEYAKNPDGYFEPGKTNREIELYEENDDSVIVKVEKGEQVLVKEEQIPGEPNYRKISQEEASSEIFSHLRNTKIRFLGEIKGGEKDRLKGLAKTNNFKVDYWDDYKKVTNRDLRAMQYSNSIDGILVGPMPHSIEGMGNYSSGLEMIRKEPGYPPVVTCYNGSGNDKRIKVTKTSIRNALRELDNILASK